VGVGVRVAVGVGVGVAVGVGVGGMALGVSVGANVGVEPGSLQPATKANARQSKSIVQPPQLADALPDFSPAKLSAPIPGFRSSTTFCDAFNLTISPIHRPRQSRSINAANLLPDAASTSA